MRNKKFSYFQKGLRYLALTKTVLTVLAAVLSTLSGLLVVRILRYLDTAQRTLPTLEEAAKRYLEENPRPEPPLSSPAQPDGQKRKT